MQQQTTRFDNLIIEQFIFDLVCLNWLNMMYKYIEYFPRPTPHHKIKQIE